jgi:hypothetical protein
MIAWLVTHAALAMTFAFVCHGVGRLLIRDNAAAATALGYGILGQLVFVLAALGVLTRPHVLGLFAVAIVASFVSLPPRRTRIALRPLHLLVLAGSIPSFLIALYPPIGYDTTMYHLVYARLFAQSGRLVFADALRFPVFPQLAEMHFTAALLLFGDHAAQLTQWLALPVTALATATLVRLAGGGERAALVAAALWLGTPYAVYLSGSGYIDVSLTMFATLAIASTMAGFAARAGAFAGMAAATKYHGLFFVATMIRRHRWLAFLAAAALFAAPWYLHIARTTGNPLFPYMRGLFGDSEYRTRLDQSLLTNLHDPLRARSLVQPEPLSASIVRHAILEPLRGGVSPESPVLVLLLPLAIAAAFVVTPLRRPLVAAAAYALLVAPLDWRFMLVLVPLLAAAIAVVLERLLAPLPSARLTYAIAAICLLPGFAWGSLLMMVKYGPMPVTPVQRDAFVAQHIDVYRAVRSLGPATVYVLRGPQMAYYCPGKCLGDQNGPHRWALIDPLRNDPPRLAAKLRGFGATHLVIAKANTQFAAAAPFRLVYEDAKAAAYAIDAK